MHSEDMVKKSEFFLMKNEAVHADMVDIMQCMAVRGGAAGAASAAPLFVQK